MGNLISDTIIKIVKQQVPRVVRDTALHTHVNYSGDHIAPVARSWSKAYGWAVALVVIFTLICCAVTALVVWCLIAELQYKRDKDTLSSSDDYSDESYYSTDEQQNTGGTTAETPQLSYDNDASSERDVEMVPTEVWANVGRNPLRARGETEGDDDRVSQVYPMAYREDYVQDYVQPRAYDWPSSTYTHSREDNMYI